MVLTRAKVFCKTILLSFVLTMLMATRFTMAWTQPKVFHAPASKLINKVSALRNQQALFMSSYSSSGGMNDNSRGRLLVLGGTGYLGQAVCQRAIEQGYQVTSLSRRGLPPSNPVSQVEYRQGDARQKNVIQQILQEQKTTGLVHCIGLLFDDQSGLGNINRFVSGSGSIPDTSSSYDTITRLTAFNAIDAVMEYVQKQKLPQQFPFAFTSAAEAGWPDVVGGSFVEERLAPDFLRRYLQAKRAVEQRLLDTPNQSSFRIRPIIARPSLIYSTDRPLSFPSVGAFFVGNAIGLPFVDRPVNVEALSAAIVSTMDPNSSTQGILRYPQIDQLSGMR
jgi:nucleoside-diphosphate-sugar epimerase